MCVIGDARSDALVEDRAGNGFEALDPAGIDGGKEQLHGRVSRSAVIGFVNDEQQCRAVLERDARGPPPLSVVVSAFEDRSRWQASARQLRSTGTRGPSADRGPCRKRTTTSRDGQTARR